MFGRRNRIADELARTNSYLALIAEVIQKEPDRRYRALRKEPRVEINVPPLEVDWPRPLTDATELLARWLWLQLPEESKKDLMP